MRGDLRPGEESGGAQRGIVAVERFDQLPQAGGIVGRAWPAGKIGAGIGEGQRQRGVDADEQRRAGLSLGGEPLRDRRARPAPGIAAQRRRPRAADLGNGDAGQTITDRAGPVDCRETCEAIGRGVQGAAMNGGSGIAARASVSSMPQRADRSLK
jgi:hypothetical protein